GAFEDAAAVSRSASEVLAQLKDFLIWTYKQDPWLDPPDFLRPELRHFKVFVRPRYQVGNRVYPCDETMKLKIACVHGSREDGLSVAALPALDAQFDYYQDQSLKQLVSESVQRTLHGLTPAELHRLLPSEESWLEEIVVRVQQKDSKTEFQPSVPNLSVVAEPLAQRAMRKRFNRAWERETETADLARRLGKERANVVLLGETGVGRTTLLVEAVRRLARDSDPPKPNPNQPNSSEADSNEAEAEAERSRLQRRWRFWLTSGAQLIAGMQYLGQWEERLEYVLDELAGLDGCLCVENLLELVRVGGQTPHDGLAAFLIPYLQRSEARIVGAATPAEWDACRRLLPGFADAFQVMIVPDFDRPTAISVLERTAAAAEAQWKVGLSEGVAAQTYRLFHRFLPYHAMPGKASRFLKGLFERAAREDLEQVDMDWMLSRFASHTGLPELFLRDEIPLSLGEVEENFRGQVIGQENACRAAAQVVTTFKAGLNDPQRPVGVMLFCGPTGVGKTELAKAVSRFLFEHGEQPDDRLARLDMSEYNGLGAADRLLQSPDGEPSELINKIRRQPFSVVLLDEIEKASPDVFDVMLSLFDEGRLTDRFGRVTDFRSAIVIMTSNLGAQRQASVGFSPSGGPNYDRAATSFFRPEFYNRIDAVVTFDPLPQDAVLSITRKELGQIARREGLEKKNLQLTWSDRLAEFLARDGYDVRYGARPLQRTLEAKIVAPLARKLLDVPNLKDAEIHLDLDDDGELVVLC
ncbi:MAG: AAA family ATPase, partial [Planctomycetales bacterium]